MADDIRNESGSAELPKFCCDGTVSGEVSEDFVLPDYMPQISRILRLEYRAIPDSKYIGTGTVEFSGTVTYTIVYVSTESRVCSVSLSSDYEGKGELPENTVECRVVTGVENAACRLLGPRKLSTRARIRSKILAVSEFDFTENIESAAQDVLIEKLEESEETTLTRFFESRDIRIDEKMDSAGGRPVFCTAVIVPGVVTAQNDAVVVTGDAIVRALFENSDGGDGEAVKYKSVTRKIAFERSVRADGVIPGDRCHAEGNCVSVTVGTSEDESGSDCSVDFDIFITVCRKKTFGICRDVYAASQGLLTEPIKREVETYCAGMVNGNFTMTATAARRDVNAASAGEIIDVAVYPDISSVNLDGKKLVVSGNSKINVIMREKTDTTAEGGDGYFMSAGEFNSPFKYECDVSVPDGELVWVSAPTMLSSSGRLDGDKINVETEIGISAVVWSKTKMSAVEKVVLSQIEPEYSGVVISYPGGDETLWDMAKRYRVPVDKLASQNSMESVDKLKNISAGTPVIVDVI